MIQLKEATSDHDFMLAADLFKEYATAIGVDLSFQHFNEEIANLQQQYARPTGILCLASGQDQNPMGCFGIRALDGPICELKRMYVRPEARGKGLGKRMLHESLALASELGYQKMRLDTLPSMQAAMQLYESLGFYEIEPYRFNPIEDTRYYEIVLKPQ